MIKNLKFKGSLEDFKKFIEYENRRQQIKDGRRDDKEIPEQREA